MSTTKQYTLSQRDASELIGKLSRAMSITEIGDDIYVNLVDHHGFNVVSVIVEGLTAATLRPVEGSE